MVQAGPESALDAFVLGQGEDFVRERFPLATRLHAHELAVGTVGLSHEEVKDPFKFATSCWVWNRCNFIGNCHQRP